MTRNRVVAGTEPYPWPWDGALAPHRLALVLAGDDVVWRHRAHVAGGHDERAAALAGVVRATGGLVVRIRHDGAAPVPDATAAGPGDVVLTAAGLDGFFGSALDTTLRRTRRDQLLLAGWGLEGPVHSTLRAANDRGYECLLVTDAAAPLTDETEAAAAAMVTMSGGIFGAIGRTTDVLAALATVTRPVDIGVEAAGADDPKAPEKPEDPHDRDLVP